ncbi:hypothetical protein DL762_001073 [Monosporascus cannonballus]|uniref:Carrier domain-containing protein n=1 Tax=Monosporascus cannonballus TaxID=155416 RepID=A0ABY0HHS6_9PEZI|nr:hypothetical protein DL762_001073 [Monosporascus cannonballus]RYO98840.1 hypothetical protein DL763_001883 [Monosporascus cannonballus]
MAPHAVFDSYGPSTQASNRGTESTEPIAVVGMGQGKFPKSRFNVDGFHHPKGADRSGSVSMTGGYFIEEDIRAFDNEFFGINNLEATYMDPQQRKLLEVAFECFESAGGPSLVLDTACSSTLYCLHVACAALEAGECEAALVAGANLVQSPEQHMSIMKAGVLSPTSTCHTFDASADGYGRADGVGALYLKRLKDAIRDGDPIRSIIRATAVNHNGRTQGITLPSANGQEAVILKAYEKCGLSPRETAYVECHGTGTPVGDPIEIEAIARLMRRLPADPLLIGGVKPNLGHSEAASGITSIIKASLMLEKNFILPTIGVTKVNPKIKCEDWGVKIVTEGQPWPNSETSTFVAPPRRVSINAFGYGGANAHAILEHAGFDKLRSPQGTPEREVFLLPFSASSRASLNARVEDLAKYGLQSVSMEDLAYTLGSRRSHLSERGFVIARGPSIRDDVTLTRLRTPSEDSRGSPQDFAFIFTGQGAQWPEMGKELFAEFPVFRKAVSEMEAGLNLVPHRPSWSLKEIILEPKATSKIMEPLYAQPTCTAIQIGLIKLLASWGFVPSAVLGHSSGEIAAAFAAGFISSAEAICIAYYRGYVVGREGISSGAMMAVGLSQEAAAEAILTHGHAGKVTIACINSPENVTISGDVSSIDNLLNHFQKEGIFARKLQTKNRAYHSHHMLPLGNEYERLLRKALPLGPFDKLPSGCSWISSVNGSILRAEDVGPHYWRMNLENPVEFSGAVSRLWDTKKCYLIELGPHSALEMPINQIRASLGISKADMPYSAALVRNRDAAESVLTLAGTIFLQGQDVSFDKVNGINSDKECPPSSRPRVVHDLPKYRWTYSDTPLWAEPRESVEFRNRVHQRHELLGSLVPGGNGVEKQWRNIFRLEEAAWMEDHKLENTVVFPAAGYMAMAIEAVMQTAGTEGCGAVHFRNFNILAALAISTDPSAKLELHTSLKPAQISYATSSKTWWDISIVSFTGGISTVHVNSMVGVTTDKTRIEARVDTFEKTLASTAPRVWYEALIREGLNFGPAFRSIIDFSVDRMRKLNQCRSLTRLLRSTPNEDYPIHPVTIDAMLQTSIIAVTAGTPEILRAIVPTRIGAATFLVGGHEADQPVRICSNATAAGFGASIMNAELRNESGDVIVQLQDVRAAPYQAATRLNMTEQQRHPMLRVLWKPDTAPGSLDSSGLTRYLDSFSCDPRAGIFDEGSLKLLGCISLLSHKNPSLRVLEIGDGSSELASATLDMLQGNSAFPRLLSYGVGRLDENGRLLVSDVNIKTGEISKETDAGEDEIYDVILFASSRTAHESFEKSLDAVQNVIAPRGALLALLDRTSKIDLQRSKLVPVLSELAGEQGSILLAQKTMDDEVYKCFDDSHLYIVYRYQGPLLETVVHELKAVSNRDPVMLRLEDVKAGSVSPGAIVVSFLELEEPLLATSTDAEMRAVKEITDNASALVWITGGGLLTGSAPTRGLASGLSRAVMVEQPALKFVTFDVDDIHTKVELTSRNIINTLLRSSIGGEDREFVQKDGVVHISRYAPDDGLNELFGQKQGLQARRMTLEEANNVQLAIGVDGQLDSLFFKQIPASQALGPDDVEVEVRAVGLNAKDYFAVMGRVDTRDATCTLEHCGIVRRTGSSVEALRAGDRVVVMAPGKFKAFEVVPSWACQKLGAAEDMNVMSTLPLVYSTAIYALQSRANLQPGESILIHSGASAVGMASIQLAHQAGAEVYTTVSSAEKKRYLVETFGVRPENVFSSRDVSFAEDLLRATRGRGVDVVLNSLAGELLHASWRCCAEFGRFVEIGKRDLADAGGLAMEQFLGSATFTAFDLTDFYYSSNPARNRTWASLLARVVELYRQGRIRAFPSQIFDVADVTGAFRVAGSSAKIGKVVVNLENPRSVIMVRPSRYSTKLSPEKSYLMIGCLGGLGRSISKWMMDRGARNFVFLGRSGLDKAPARHLVEDLEANGASCVVVRGDVCSTADVEAMVQSAEHPIGGVVQAAMGLYEALWTSMENSQWHTGIDPKVQGTWNIHNALQGRDSELDFFLMTSSISGSVGTATEANYCAGNYFLDVFARYRRSLGLPAVSVGLGMISEVGYLHENPEIEALLLRKGIQPIPESEFLTVVDISLSSSSSETDLPRALGRYDSGAGAHILTGLEPTELVKIRKRGFEGSYPGLGDPRSAVLSRALHMHTHNTRTTTQKRGVVGGGGDGNPLPTEVAEDLEAGTSLADAVRAHVSRRFGSLVLLPPERVDARKPLDAYGMDSMVGAEFRSWFYRSFGVNVPFLELLGRSTTLDSLAGRVVREIEKREGR